MYIILSSSFGGSDICCLVLGASSAFSATEWNWFIGAKLMHVCLAAKTTPFYKISHNGRRLWAKSSWKCLQPDVRYAGGEFPWVLPLAFEHLQPPYLWSSAQQCSQSWMVPWTSGRTLLQWRFGFAHGARTRGSVAPWRWCHKQRKISANLGG